MERELFEPNNLTFDDIDGLKDWQMTVAAIHFAPGMGDCVRFGYGYFHEDGRTYCVGAGQCNEITDELKDPLNKFTVPGLHYKIRFLRMYLRDRLEPDNDAPHLLAEVKRLRKALEKIAASTETKWPSVRRIYSAQAMREIALQALAGGAS